LINFEDFKEKFVEFLLKASIYKYTDILLKLVYDVVGVGIGCKKKIILEDSTKKE
jgi:hypothetical protein